jgi:hypothetical protein
VALREHEDWITIPADKGYATVIMNIEDYRGKMNELLNEPTYKVLQKDPTNRVEWKTAALIRKPDTTGDVAKKLIPSASVPLDLMVFRIFIRRTSR